MIAAKHERTSIRFNFAHLMNILLIFVIIFVCFAQKCRQKFVFSVALQRAIARCYKNFTPSGLGAVVLRDSVLSSFLIASHKNAAKNLCFPLHCNGLSPVATKISPFEVMRRCAT
ncbi:MAG: hypothetical protein U0T81_18055 [Saprospiraceae bacterium]